MAAWLVAIRPRTLTVALSPVLLGAAVAWQRGVRDWLVAGLCLVGAVLLQVASNLANDVFDARKGADGRERKGPPRAVSSGWLRDGQVIGALVRVLVAALVVGVFLVARGGWPIVAIGLSAMVSAVAYTAGPYPLGYHGLGDLFVFLYFGLAAVAGTTWVLAGRWDPLAFALALPVGGYGAAVLTVNNIRDREGDERVGKRTLAVRLGAGGARAWYAVLLALPHAVVAALIAARWVGWSAGLSFLVLPLALRLVRTVRTHDDGPTLNASLGGTARLQLLWALALTPGVANGW
jgi:1,4-dihydroxy-2-naphthoate octaprenyltransferase